MLPLHGLRGRGAVRRRTARLRRAHSGHHRVVVKGSLSSALGALAWALVLLGFAWACRGPTGEAGAGNDALERVWESEHFVYRSRPEDDSVCPGVLESFERHFEAVRSTLGFSWPENTKIVYGKFVDQRSLRGAGACRSRNEACFVAERGVPKVFTSDPFDRHELVHAYLAPLGDSHQVLEEGIASAIACDQHAFATPPRVTLAEAFDAEHWETGTAYDRRGYYQAAASFVADVFRRHGRETFLTLYREIRRGRSLDSIQSSYERLTQEPLLSAWERALSRSRADIACLVSWECAAKEYPRSGVASWFERCEQDDHAYTLELGEPTWVGEESRGAGIRFEACGADPPSSASADVPTSEMKWRVLGPGRYFVAKRDPKGAFGLSFGPTSRSSVEACERAESLPASFPRSLVVEFAESARARQSAALWVRIEDTEREGSSDYQVSCSSGLDAAWCRGCDSVACEPLCEPSGGVAVRRFADEDIVLRVRPSQDGHAWLRIVRTDF